MTDVEAGDASGPADPSVAELRKELIRQTRRAERLELTLRQLEEIRDTNTRLLDRLRAELGVERARSQALLLNVLPQRIVDRLNAGEERIADAHSDVAVVFSDFVGFTEIAARRSVDDLVVDLGGMFAAFDAACDRLGVEKIKTIGDAYLAAAGLARHDGERDAGGHAAAAAELALDMLDAVAARGPGWRIRIGIDCGPVVSGVIGTRTFAYDVWGDTVNVASRLEGSSEPGRIHVSATVAALLADRFVLEPRGAVVLKGKGAMETFFLAGRVRDDS
ncbi:MAG TPA: adenylate/guanylate cyclase domain-containing protein [Candidatus Limnocylindrales bacterium]